MYTIRINELWKNFANNFQKSCRKYLKYFCDIFVPSICISNWNKHVDALNACSLETFCASGYIYDLRMFLQHLLQIPKRLFVALFYTKLLLARYYALGKFWYTDSNACIAFLFFINLGNNIYCLIFRYWNLRSITKIIFILIVYTRYCHLASTFRLRIGWWNVFNKDYA